MIIQTSTMINILKFLEEETNTDLTKEIEEIFNSCLICEKEQENFEVEKIETLEPDDYCIKINGKKENIYSINYDKKRKVYCLVYKTGSKKDIKKIEVNVDIDGVSIVKLLNKFNII